MACIGVPLPYRMQVLPRAPPVALGDANDHGALELIKHFGQELDCGEDEILQAFNLASGPADLVVILLRPHKNQKYDVTFERFVADCRTLAAVDKLIRFATNGARSIHTVTVLDAYSFKPDEKQCRPSDDECHDLVANILRIKRPRVVLCCWQGNCTNDLVQKFQSQGVGAQPLRDETVIEGQGTIIIRSFHPATLEYNRFNANYRYLLIYHFVSAFTELHRPTQMPHWMEPVRQQSWENARQPNRGIVRREAPGCVVQILRRVHGKEYRRRRGPSTGKAEAKLSQEMNNLLEGLEKSAYAGGSLDITRLLLIWMEHFRHHHAHQQVASLLFKMGAEQHDMISATDDDHVKAGMGIGDGSDNDILDAKFRDLKVHDS